MLNLAEVDKDWTLFLDRDGVINVDKSPYTLNAEEFEFYPGVPGSIGQLSTIFKNIFIVTNQRGIGRKLMTEEDLAAIHAKLIHGVSSERGKIAAIYYCTATDNTHEDRKPNPGMALRAMREHEGIIPSKSIMVGNNISDMEFGRNAGFHTVLVHTTGTKVNLPHPLVDIQFDSLPDFTKALVKSRD